MLLEVSSCCENLVSRHISAFIQKPFRQSNNGFNEREMFDYIQTSRTASNLLSEVQSIGFRYAGDTNSSSKANTNFQSKLIRVNRNLDSKEAALSLAYEMRNASQIYEFSMAMALLKSFANNHTARAYALALIQKEANSVITRSHVANEIGAQNFIKNGRYCEIARSPDLTDIQKKEAVFHEMLQNGRVLQGTVPVYEHYVQQYWNYANSGLGQV